MVQTWGSKGFYWRKWKTNKKKYGFSGGSGESGTAYSKLEIRNDSGINKLRKDIKFQVKNYRNKGKKYRTSWGWAVPSSGQA